MKIIGVYAASLISLLALDWLWLSVIASDFYKRHLDHLLAPHANLLAGGIFYVIYAIAIVALVILPASTDHSLAKVIGRGALLGLAAYAAYDLTNQATLRQWPVAVTITDMVWGMILTAIASVVGYAVAKWLGVI